MALKCIVSDTERTGSDEVNFSWSAKLQSWPLTLKTYQKQWPRFPKRGCLVPRPHIFLKEPDGVTYFPLHGTWKSNLLICLISLVWRGTKCVFVFVFTDFVCFKQTDTWTFCLVALAWQTGLELLEIIWLYESGCVWVHFWKVLICLLFIYIYLLAYFVILSVHFASLISLTLFWRVSAS